MSNASGFTRAQFADAIGQDRWARYLAATGGDPRVAFALYAWNPRVAGALLETLGHVEVILRNAMHRELDRAHRSAGHGGEWYERQDWLAPRSLADLARARDRLRTDGKPETPGRIVAAMDFGFWMFLLARRHHDRLWIPALHRSFPASGGDREVVHRRVNALVRLRNRVAHHQELFDRDLKLDETHCVELVRWIDPAMERWVRSRSRIGAIAVQDPRKRSASR